MEGDDAIPVVGWHRGVALEDRQSDARLSLVRSEIDHVLAMTDAVALADWADDPDHSPELGSSRSPWSKACGRWPLRQRNNRPPIDMDRLRASTAGLGCRRWRDPRRFCSLLDPDGGVLREQPIDDLE